MHEIHEVTHEMRAVIVQGVVQAVDDTGQAQTITVKTHDGIIRSGIEVLQIFGFASVPPIPGAVATLLAIGADPGQYVALPLGNPSFRFGGLAVGDGGAIYAQDGSRVRVLAGGVVEIAGFTKVVINSPQVQITATGGVSIAGDLTITGSLTVSGSGMFGGDVTAPNIDG